MVGTSRTSLDAEASLKINSKPSSTVSDLVTKLEIGELAVSRVGRACSGPEHRNLLLHMMRGTTADEESLTSHGKMVRDLPGPFETTSSKEVVLYQEDLSSLNYKLLLLNLLLRGSKRTMVLSEASQSQVFMAGASYGAKCGMSDPDNLPSSLHYQLVSLHHHGLLHVWAQHGHDGLPQRAGRAHSRVGLGVFPFLCVVTIQTEKKTPLKRFNYAVPSSVQVIPEGGVYPAVGVHHVARYLLHDAVNGVSDVLLGGHQQTRRHQDYKGRLD